MSDLVNHPQHYFADNGMEAIDVIDAFFHDNYYLGNVFRYTSRAGKKFNQLEDLQKARVYLDREIARVEFGIPSQLSDSTSAFLAFVQDQPLEAVVGPDEPRVWRTLADVPINITVLSAANYVWEYTPLGWRRPGVSFVPEDPNWRVTYGPWTEVL